MTTQHFPADQPGQQTRKKTPEEIEAEISETRSAITEDIKALGEKFTPENLKQGAKDALRDAKEEAKDMLRTAKDHAIDSVTETMSELGDRARHAGHVTGDFMTTNALPLALIGIGTGWLMLTMRHQRDRGSPRYLRADWQEQSNWRDRESDYLAGSGYQGGRSYREGRVQGRTHQMAGTHQMAEGGAHDMADRVREGVDELREGVGDLRERASEKLSEMGSRVKETASDLSHRASDLSHEARHQLDAAQRLTRDYARENPMAVGALAIAAGVGVGMLLPMTRPENRLMGPTRDRLLGDARETAERVGRTARDAVGDMREAIAEPSAH